jgi:hypothetical protein
MIRRPRHAAAALALLTTLGLASCGDPAVLAELKALGEGCLLDSDCAEDLVCVFRLCHYQCVETKDCLAKPAAPPDVRCVKGDKPTNVCLLEGEIECGAASPEGELVLDSSRCPGQLVCGADGECRDACTADHQCVATQTCVQGTCADGDELNTLGLLTDPSASTEGAPCIYHSDCAQPLACKAGFCLEACKQDVDCPAGQGCVVDEASGLRVCRAPVEPGAPSHCGDGAVSGDETGLDCGGSCAPCASGEPCEVASDCEAGVCGGGVCQVASCVDGVKNQTETAIDCGGVDCPPCPACSGPADCEAGQTCVAQTCVGDHCQSGVLDGDETSADCGGSCAPCDVGDACDKAGDCLTLACVAGACAQPSCTDGVQNGAETGQDCGGPCAPCGVGGGCSLASDCATGSCVQGVCAQPSCSDGTQNGFETGVDCGGTCAGCPAGEPCVDSADCDAASTVCDLATSLCANVYTLTVQKAGTGDGVVTSSQPAGAIDCGATCAVELLEGAQVVLAHVASGSVFDGFSGACVGPSCSLTMTGDLDVTATFTATDHGNTLWGISNIGSNQFDGYPRALAIDSQGAVVVTGDLRENESWGAGPTKTLISDHDLLVAKLLPNGTDTPTHVWSKNWGNALLPSNDYYGRGVGVDSADDVLVAVRTHDDLRMNASTLLACDADASGLAAVKLSGATGDFVAGSCIGRYLTITDALVDGNDDLVVVGTYTTGDPLVPGLPAPAGTDAFIARFDGATMQLALAARLGGGAMDAANAVSLAQNGDLLVAGACTGNVTWGGGAPVTTGFGGTDLCGVRLDGVTLSPVAAHQNGGPGADKANGLAELPDGRLVLAGSFVGSNVDFGDNVGRTSGGTSDIVLLELDGATLALFDQANKPASVAEYGSDASGENEQVSRLTIDSTGAILLGGTHTGGVLDFGGGPLPGTHETYLVRFSAWKQHDWTRSNLGELVLDLETRPNGEPVLAGYASCGGACGLGAETDWSGGALGPMPYGHVVGFTP